jgi:hypothetical protein
MSTKTTFKRVALATVAAMGFGLLSVVPANAGATDSDLTYVFTTTGATATPTAGSAVVIPFTLTVANGEASTGILSATITTKPTNSALDAENDLEPSATVANSLDTAKMTTAATASTATVAGFLTHTWVSDASEAATAAGSFSFTPDVPGLYIVTAVTGTGTGADEFTTAGSTDTSLTVEINVTGAQLVQAASGLGAATGTQINGRNFAAAYHFAAGTTTTSRFQITTSAGASLVAVNNVATLTNPASATASATTAGVSYVNGTSFASGALFTPQVASQSSMTAEGSGDATEAIVISANAAASGRHYIYVKEINGTTGVLTTVATITVDTTGAAEIAATSTAYMAAVGASTFSATTSAVARQASRTSGTAIADIKISIVDTNGSADTRANTVIASTTGVGFIAMGGSQGPANASQRRIVDETADAERWVRIYSDGTAGTGSVTITLYDAVSDAAISLGTFSYTSTTSAASLTVSTSRYKIGRAGYTTGGAAASAEDSWVSATATTPVTPITAGVTTPAFVVQVKDSSGNLVTPSATPVVLSSDLAVSSGGTCALDDGLNTTYSSSTNGIGVYNCNFTIVDTAKSGDKATLTIRIADPLSTTGGYLTTTYDITVGGAAGSTGGTETVAFDKATYDTGEGMTITRTCKDASGNPCYDGQIAGAVTFSKAVGGTAPTAAFYIAGTTSSNSSIGAKTVFAPVVSGAFTANMTGRVSGVSSNIAATATVSDDAATAASSAAADAAAEATDAANAATDAANAAAEAADAATAAAQDAADAVAALSTQVSEMVNALKKQITALTNLVIKIQKKVKA